MTDRDGALRHAVSTSRRWVGGDDHDSRAAEGDYDQLAPDYDQVVAAWGYEGAGRVADLLVRHAPPRARILDAGCGTGLLGTALAARGHHDLRGVDISARSLEQARTRGVYRDLRRADLQRPLPFGDGTFGAVGCAGVLTYVDELPTLAELRRVVAPGGVVAFSHREDLLQRRRLEDRFHELEAAGAWHRLERSGSQPYMPGHPDYADRIRVVYFAFRVGGRGSVPRDGAP